MDKQRIMRFGDADLVIISLGEDGLIVNAADIIRGIDAKSTRV